jgi:ribose transport system permease protein
MPPVIGALAGRSANGRRRQRVVDARDRTTLVDAVTITGVWVVMATITAIHRHDFLSRQTLLAITFTMAIAGIMAVAQAVIVLGGALLDLSLPITLIAAAFAAVSVLGRGWPTGVAVLAGIAAGALVGVINATVVVVGRLNPIIVTLATNFGGLAFLHLMFLSAETPINSGLRRFGLGRWLGLPNVFWLMIAMIGLAGLAIAFTRWGRHLRAVGGNSQAAKARGLSLRRTRFFTFVAAGAIAGVAGVCFAAVNPQFGPNGGANYQLTVIAAVILAGISLSGGKGNLLVLFLSVGFISTIPVTIAFFGLTSVWTEVFQGALLVVAVGIDGYRLKRGAK